MFVCFPVGSKSQSALWNAITAGMGIKGKEQKAPLNDPRSPEEILADELPAADEPDATEKTAIRFAVYGFSLLHVNYNEVTLGRGAAGHRQPCPTHYPTQASFAYSRYTFKHQHTKYHHRSTLFSLYF